MIDNDNILTSSIASGTAEDLSTSIRSTSVQGNLTYTTTDTGIVDASKWWGSAGYYSNYSKPLSSPMFYNSEELLSTIRSIFDSYGFEFSYNSNDDVVSNNSISEKETSSDILGWVAVGFLKNKYYSFSFQLLLRFATDNKLDPTAITLTVKEGSYFENFSIKILLENENNLVLIDSTSGIVHIIQEMLLENLQKAFDEIFEMSLGTKTKLETNPLNSYCNGVGVSSAVDTSIAVNKLWSK